MIRVVGIEWWRRGVRRETLLRVVVPLGDESGPGAKRRALLSFLELQTKMLVSNRGFLDSQDGVFV
jgi:hypothetical protein